MNVYSELIKAQAENLSSDPTPATKGRIYHKSTTEPLKVDDGTTIHSVLTDKMYASIKSQGAFSLNYQKSSVCTSFSTTTAADVTNLTVTITTLGGPVEIFLVGGDVQCYQSGASAATVAATIELKKDGSEIFSSTVASGIGVAAGGGWGVQVPAGSIKFFDTPAAGTYTYKIHATALVGTIAFNNTALVAKELK